jgi:radical SAM superfamily enzyme
MLETAKTIATMGIDGVKLHLLYVVRGTALEKLYRQGGYTCLGQDEYAERVCDFLENIPADMIIQRLTGDPHPNELVAPAWSLDRNGTLALIKAKLSQRNSWQGKSIEK